MRIRARNIFRVPPPDFWAAEAKHVARALARATIFTFFPGPHGPMGAHWAPCPSMGLIIKLSKGTLKNMFAGKLHGEK